MKHILQQSVQSLILQIRQLKWNAQIRASGFTITKQHEQVALHHGKVQAVDVTLPYLKGIVDGQVSIEEALEALDGHFHQTAKEDEKARSLGNTLEANQLFGKGTTLKFIIYQLHKIMVQHRKKETPLWVQILLSAREKDVWYAAYSGQTLKVANPSWNGAVWVYPPGSSDPAWVDQEDCEFVGEHVMMEEEDLEALINLALDTGDKEWFLELTQKKQSKK